MTTGTNRRILLIDDNQAIHQDFRKILRASGGGTTAAVSDAKAAFFGAAASASKAEPRADEFEIESAYQGQEALAKVQQSLELKQPYAMAFVDVRMPPGWDGVETIARLWTVDPDLQVVICTAFADYSWDDMIKKLGQSDRLLILKKPFDPVEVCQLAGALTEKWNATWRGREQLREVQRAEQEARVYAATLVTVNRALEQAKASAESAARAKSEFLANMSHEMRTPMIAILGYADLMSDASLPVEGRAECVETIRSHSRHLLTVVNDVLDMANIETGRLEIVRARCSPWSICEGVVEILRPRADEKGLALKLQAAGSLPQWIQSDEVRVRQVLMHLIGNAIKFTERGSVTVELGHSARGASSEKELEIRVSDTGIGIAEDDQRKLFESFAPLDGSASRKHVGAGLGLALSRRLARMLGGDIAVDSTPGAGSRFTFTIKIGDASGGSPEHEPKAALPSSAPKASPAADAPLCGRILLVEDVQATQRLYAHLLRRAGAEVTVADDGRQAVDHALAALRDGRAFDLVLMDMQLPGTSGYEATAELRQRGYRGAIVAVTAHTMSGDREKCLAVGCDAYAAKPIERSALVELCRQYLTVATPASALPAPKSKGETAPSQPRS